jgi:hypothetical protein
MPISKKRKKTELSQVHDKQVAQEPVTFFIIGLLYVITFYLAGSSVPGMSSLSAAANIGIGFSFIIVGFFLSTKWR